MPTAKKQLRRAVLAAIQTEPPEALTAASAQIRQRILQSDRWRRSRTILAFAPMAREPDIWPLIAGALADGLQIFLPRYVAADDRYEPALLRNPEADLRPGKWGIREPIAACPAGTLMQLDFILVPGVAFDASGRRLGHGRGYYDRLLAGISGWKCGVAFCCQIVADVPTSPRDIGMDGVVTPGGWLLARPGSNPT